MPNLNECTFCQMSHSAFAAFQHDGGMEVYEPMGRRIVEHGYLQPAPAPR